MKKDKKWFIDKWTKERDKTDVHDPMYHFITEFITDVRLLDEPEVSPQYSIDENKEDSDVKYIGYCAPIGRVHDLTLPTQELPAIPKYMAEYLESAKGKIPLMRALEIASRRDDWSKWTKEYDWISSNDEAFATAWLSGYEEEESLYYALIKGHELMTDEDDAYWNLRTDDGRLFPSDQSMTHDGYLTKMSKEDWNKLGINDSNADFVKAIEM